METKNNADLMEDIAELLRDYGEVFTGGEHYSAAADWIAAEFTDLDEVEGWCMADVWEPRVAAKLRSAGVSPKGLAGIVAEMTRGMTDDERRNRWTDGSPVYAACNGDVDVEIFLKY